jgi:hypothetical protein
LRDDLKFFLTGTRRCKKDKGRHKKDKKNSVGFARDRFNFL